MLDLDYAAIGSKRYWARFKSDLFQLRCQIRKDERERHKQEARRRKEAWLSSLYAAYASPAIHYELEVPTMQSSLSGGEYSVGAWRLEPFWEMETTPTGISMR